MVRRMGLARVLAVFGLLYGLANAAIKPTFQDVSQKKGLLAFDRIDKARLDFNKYYGVCIADMRRRGRYDLYTPNHQNNPEFYTYLPGQEKYQYKNPRMLKRDLHAVAAADINNDGVLDLVMNVGGSLGEDVTGVPLGYLGDSLNPPEFSRKIAARMGLGDIPMRGRSMSFVDINADGYLDLIFINKKNETPTDISHLVFENMKNGKFRLRQNTGIEKALLLWHQIIDANNDSLPDILLFGYRGMQLWLGTGDFKFSHASYLIQNATEIKNARCAAEIDFDGDGDLDLMIARGGADTEESDILLEKKGSRYEIVTRDVGLLPGGIHSHVTTGDVNNDGFVDMYISRQITNFTRPRQQDYLMLNAGDGTFYRSYISEILAERDTDGDNGLIYDYNQDGNPDLLVGSRRSQWKLYENTGSYVRNHFTHIRVGEPRAQRDKARWFTRKALGATVVVLCGGKEFRARVGSPGQSHSQSYMDTLHIGLGTCSSISKVEVHYPGEVLVTRKGPLPVDTTIQIGLYFDCSAGSEWAQNCGFEAKGCNKNPCGPGESCEVYELVGTKCFNERCGLSPDTPPALDDGTGETPFGLPGPELLTNGNFERSTGWKLSGDAVYERRWALDGAKSSQLPWAYSAVEQERTLVANGQYRLVCGTRSGPVVYKIFFGGVLIAQDASEPTIDIPGTDWQTKPFYFSTTQRGKYLIRLSTAKGIIGSVDECSLKQLIPGATPPSPSPTPEVTPIPTVESSPTPEISPSPGDSGVELLKNGDFEKWNAWDFLGDAGYENRWSFDGSRCVRLQWGFAGLEQPVNLVAGSRYRLSCAVLTGPIYFKILFGNEVVANDTSGDVVEIPSSMWDSKELDFSATRSGTYIARITAAKSVQGSVDACSLRELLPDVLPTATAEPPNPVVNLLGEPSFESGREWIRTGAAILQTSWSFEGSTCLQLAASGYARAEQRVELESGTRYALKCAILGGPVMFRVRLGWSQGTVIVKDFSEATESIPARAWKYKTSTFTTTDAGRHTVQFVTSNGGAGSVDSCTLWKVSSSRLDVHSTIDVLENGDFEGDGGWETLGSVEYAHETSFSGLRSLRMPSGYSEIQQYVDLIEGTEYKLTCKHTSGGTMEYRLFRGNIIVRTNFRMSDYASSKSGWRSKSMRYQASETATYRLVLTSPSGTAGLVDDCSLKVIPAPSPKQTPEVGQAHVQNYSNQLHGALRQTECRSECVKYYCRV